VVLLSASPVNGSESVGDYLNCMTGGGGWVDECHAASGMDVEHARPRTASRQSGGGFSRSWASDRRGVLGRVQDVAHHVNIGRALAQGQRARPQPRRVGIAPQELLVEVLGLPQSV